MNLKEKTIFDYVDFNLFNLQDANYSKLFKTSKFICSVVSFYTDYEWLARTLKRNSEDFDETLDVKQHKDLISDIAYSIYNLLSLFGYDEHLAPFIISQRFAEVPRAIVDIKNAIDDMKVHYDNMSVLEESGVDYRTEEMFILRKIWAIKEAINIMENMNSHENFDTSLIDVYLSAAEYDELQQIIAEEYIARGEN